MNNQAYSITSIVAIIIYLIINHDILKKPYEKKYIAEGDYRRYLNSVMIFYIADAVFGIIGLTGSIQAAYCATAMNFIAMGITAIFWCCYIVAYLELSQTMATFLQDFGIAFVVFELFVVAINSFAPIFFWFDETGTYHVGIFRHIAYVILIVLFVSIAILSGSVMIKANKENKKRYGNISAASILMVSAIIMQTLFPTSPMYAIGLMICNCVLHVFVQEQEKDEFRKKLQEQEKKLRENSEVIANAGHGIWKISIEKYGDNKMIVNETLRKIFGIEDLNLTPEEMYRYYHGRLLDDVSEIENDDYQAMLSGQLRSRILTWNHPYKGKVYLTAGGTQHIEEDGKRIISGYCADITEQQLESKRLNDSLQEARKQAEAASEAKTRFLFNMSHDIRTPINAIIGFTNLMEKNYGDEEKCIGYIHKMRGSGEFLLSLVNNVLEMARIESGQVGLDESVCCIPDFADSLKSVFEEQMKQKGLAFVIHTDIIHDKIIVDTIKLREIYLNLISNGYKYTMTGGAVTLEITEMPADKDGYLKLRSVIKDTGIGISKEFLPHIFEDFTRETSSTDNKIEGTGLGMPIVKQYLELMNGSIDVESEIGKGTAFTFTIEHKIAETNDIENEVITSKDIECFKGKRILLAEDNEMNAEIAIELLSELGFMIDVAADGVICIDMLEKASANYYDLILMDIQMPNLDGFKTTKLIRNCEDKIKASIPIVAMTANAFDEDRRKAIEAGMNDHLPKPVDVQQMTKVLLRIIRNKEND